MIEPINAKSKDVASTIQLYRLGADDAQAGVAEKFAGAMRGSSNGPLTQASQAQLVAGPELAAPQRRAAADAVRAGDAPAGAVQGERAGRASAAQTANSPTTPPPAGAERGDRSASALRLLSGLGASASGAATSLGQSLFAELSKLASGLFGAFSPRGAEASANAERLTAGPAVSVRSDTAASMPATQVTLKAVSTNAEIANMATPTSKQATEPAAPIPSKTPAVAPETPVMTGQLKQPVVEGSIAGDLGADTRTRQDTTAIGLFGFGLLAGRKAKPEQADPAPEGIGYLGDNLLGATHIVLMSEGRAALSGPDLDILYGGATIDRYGVIRASEGGGARRGCAALIGRVEGDSVLVMTPYYEGRDSERRYRVQVNIDGIGMDVLATVSGLIT